MLINFVFGIIIVGLPFVQIQILHFSNNVYGMTEAIFSVGMIASAIWLSVRKSIQFPLFHSWKMINIMGILLFLLGLLLAFPLAKLYFVIGIAAFNFFSRYLDDAH
ncbi:permease [Listeria floridensis FSL S10-1187]|uniref:Permease n=1 Tax=Listeria floridensis FSL S10-1187 TaxID=1265817 RepID=A0ABP3B1I0_9LIST|nr:hypothetical protein [Listeria floridensis]EUJ33739.1 permease [Listeria floridensis FSL S10-1187]